MYYYAENERNIDCPPLETTHVHEIQGATYAMNFPTTHSHRFASTTSKPIRVGNNEHIHEVRFTTDSFNNHNHEFYGKTSRAITVGDRHVHFVQAITNLENGHRHEFRTVTQLNDATSNVPQIY